MFDLILRTFAYIHGLETGERVSNATHYGLVEEWDRVFVLKLGSKKSCLAGAYIDMLNAADSRWRAQNSLSGEAKEIWLDGAARADASVASWMSWWEQD